MCVGSGTVVKELLARADIRRCFLTLFFLLARFPLFLLLTLPVMHLDQYII